MVKVHRTKEFKVSLKAVNILHIHKVTFNGSRCVLIGKIDDR